MLMSIASLISGPPITKLTSSITVKLSKGEGDNATFAVCPCGRAGHHLHGPCQAPQLPFHCPPEGQTLPVPQGARHGPCLLHLQVLGQVLHHPLALPSGSTSFSIVQVVPKECNGYCLAVSQIADKATMFAKHTWTETHPDPTTCCLPYHIGVTHTHMAVSSSTQTSATQHSTSQSLAALATTRPCFEGDNATVLADEICKTPVRFHKEQGKVYEQRDRYKNITNNIFI